MKKAIILVLILIILFQLLSTKRTGIYHTYDDEQDIYKPVYTAKYNSDATLENNKYIHIALAIIFVISEMI